jgi:chemosensory pili system protein ChpA (sensor histidine kinase/response regulator)
VHNAPDHVVLIADDDPDLRMLVTHTLGRVGYTMIEARDGVEALEMIRERNPSLALLDVNMPRLDGFEVAEQMRADECSTPFIFVTAQSGRAHLDRVLSTRPASYIAKPFQLEKLREQVRLALLDA